MEGDRYSAETYREALASLRGVRMSYDEVRNLCAASKAAGLSFGDFEGWARASFSEYDPEETRKHWESFEEGGGVTAGTLMFMARERGWTPGERAAAPGGGAKADAAPRSTPRKSRPASYPVLKGIADPGEWDRPVARDTTPEQMQAEFINAVFMPGDYVNVVVDHMLSKQGKPYPINSGITAEVGELLHASGDEGRNIAADADPNAGAWVRANAVTPTGSGRNGSYRDADVTAFRTAIVECDELPIERQAELIRALRLPCAAVTYSGGKSLHALVRADAGNPEEYRERVNYLFGVCAANGLAVDHNCRNPSRFTRLPGVQRGDGFQALMATGQGCESWDEWETFVRDKTPVPESMYRNSNGDLMPKGVYMGPRGGINIAQDIFGDYIIGAFRVCHVGSDTGPLALWDGGRYRLGERHILRAMLGHYKGTKDADRNEVLKYITLMAPVKREASERYIAFSNGVLDLEADVLRPLSPDFLITNVIPHPYDPDANDAAVGEFLLGLANGDEPTRRNLEEVIGLVMYRSAKYRTAPVLLGSGRNGKSTFIDVLHALIGEDNYCALDMASLKKDTTRAMLAGKLANFMDDLSNEFVRGDSQAVLKTSVAGGVLGADVKFRDGITFKPTATFVMAANEFPRIEDHSSGMMDRLHPIEFRRVFRGDECDPDITARMTTPESCSALINVGLRGLRRIIENGGMTHTEAVARVRGDIVMANDTVAQWTASDDFADMMEKTGLVDARTRDAYDRYSSWCDANGVKPVGSAKFVPSVCEMFGLAKARRRVAPYPGQCTVFVPRSGQAA